MDNFKKCSKCGEVKLLDCFFRKKSAKDGHKSACKKCFHKFAKEYRDENTEKVKAREAKYRAKNSEKIKTSAYEWAEKNSGKIKTKNAKRSKDLTDAYVKVTIKQQSGVPNEIITPDLIETKRLHILIKRKLKDLTK